MNIKILSKEKSLLLHIWKLVLLAFFCFPPITILAQLKQVKSGEESPCKTARLAVGQNDYKKAAQLVQACLVESSNKNTFEYAENLLLGSEIEYYLENDSQAMKYAVSGENLYNSFGSEKQQFPLFGVRLKKILANLKTEEGEYDLALKFYEEGLIILDNVSKLLENDGGEPQLLKADLLSGIAYIELKMGLYDKAISNLKSALAITENSKADDYTKAMILNDLGHLLNEQRSHRQAIVYLKRSVEIRKKLNDQYNLASSEHNLGIAFRGIGEFNQARSSFEKVQESAVKNNFTDLKTVSSQGIASLYQYKGEHQQAIEILQEILEKTDSSVRRAEILWRLSSSRNQIGENKAARVNSKECYEWATENKNENLRYLCATNLGETYLPNSSADAEKWFRTAMDTTENLSRKVSGEESGKVFFMQDKERAYHALVQLLLNNKRISEAFSVGQKLKSRVLREKSQNRKIDLLNEKEFLIPNFPADTLSVSFNVTSENTFVFAVKEGKIIKVAKLPISENELRQRIRQYRKSILSFSPTFKTEGKELYELLLGEFAKELAETKRLIIIPDGALWELPFQALISNTSGKYLVEESEIFYTPSLNFLPHQSPLSSKKNGQKFIAFANPTRKDSPALPEAEREVTSIGRLYLSSNIFLKDKATKDQFKREAGQAEILHIAVHGVVDSDNPFDSALLFSEDEKNNGRLTVSEILQLDLPRSLLVLSSCDTSSGRVINGEGLLSLSWAFLASGGRSVVAAQWAVEEKATADLMLNFYQSLKKVQNESANALRDAQIQALNRPAPYNHPFYWAGFVAVGAVGPQR